MRQRSWTFYKVVLYLGLVLMLGLLGLVAYIAIARYRLFRRETYIQVLLLIGLLQILFYMLCIRLVHYYIPNRVQPGKSFSISYSVLLIVNGFVSIGWFVLLAFACSEVFKENRRPGSEDYSALLIIGGYTFITTYLSAASVVLRRYNRYQEITDEEKWLQQLGDHPLNS